MTSVCVDRGGAMALLQIAPIRFFFSSRRRHTRLAPLTKAAAIAAEMAHGPARAEAKRVIDEFYEHVPPADIIGRSPRDLCGAALSLWRLAERRRSGQAKIRVYNPDPLEDGWSSPHTIV